MYNNSIKCDESQGNYMKTQLSLPSNYRKLFYIDSIKKCLKLFIRYKF